MRLTKKYSILLAVLLLLVLNNTVFGMPQNNLAKPKKQELVIDNAHVFSSSEIASLKSKLNRFNRETSTQILIYTTLDLNGYDIADFAQRIGENYGVGQNKSDNGIVIVFKPKIGNSPGRVTIQTGYGIEPLIPDATANQIIDNEMIPFFKKGDIYNGINSAIDICISLTKGEFTASSYQKQTKTSNGGAGIIFIIFMITFFSVMGRSRNSKYNSMGRRSNLPLWAALFFMSSGSHRGSGWSDFSSGSGSFGGGGGFSGFGGGSFGGGGASGSW